MTDPDIEALFKKIYKNHFLLVLPGVVLATILFFVLYVLFFPTLSLCAFFLLVFYAKCAQSLVFVTDRCLSEIIGYYPLQEYLHAHFEPESKHLRLKSKILFYVGFSPFFRCRSAVLHKYQHNRKGE